MTYNLLAWLIAKTLSNRWLPIILTGSFSKMNSGIFNRSPSPQTFAQKVEHFLSFHKFKLLLPFAKYRKQHMWKYHVNEFTSLRYIIDWIIILIIHICLQELSFFLVSMDTPKTVFFYLISLNQNNGNATSCVGQNIAICIV